MASTVWRGQLTFGLVSLPVRLYTAARRERVRMHYVKQTAAAEPEPDAGSEPPAEPQPIARVHQSLTAAAD